LVGLPARERPWRGARPFGWLALGAAAFVMQAVAQGMLRFG
jgi:hypothetical protein